MKKLYIFLTAMFFVCHTWADENVIVRLKDGSRVTYAFANHPEMIHNGTSLTFAVGGSTVVYDMTEIDRVDLVGVTSEIAVAEADVRVALTDDGALMLNGLRPGSTVTIATIDGTLLGAVRVGSDGSVSSLLPGKGIFVIRTEKTTHKIIRR